MNRKLRRATARRIKAGRVFGIEPHTGRVGDLGKLLTTVNLGQFGNIMLVDRKRGAEWIPDRDVFNSSFVNL